MRHVFIIGSKGIPAHYGGFETFVDKLVENQVSQDIQYHVACAVDDAADMREFTRHGAHCFTVLRRPIGAANAITYDVDAFNWCLRYIKVHHVERPVVYVLACRIGPFIGHLSRRLHKLGGTLLVNPDGHEWLRSKWSAPVRKYWRISERGMVKHADLLVCDSEEMERYIRYDYARLRPRTTFIAYGADTRRSRLADDAPEWISWLSRNHLKPDGYYVVVGRFVPENNYETMIREFMASHTTRSLALVTKAEGAFLEQLEEKLHCSTDPRIKFVGTVYDQELLKKIRENAHGYLHGHEVGGTNPSLLEAMASTRLNLLLGVPFNQEVGQDNALYWTKEEGSLAALIDEADAMPDDTIARLDENSTRRINEAYSWKAITERYERLFLSVDFTTLSRKPRKPREKGPKEDRQ